jgi:hypothetical protein
VKNGSLMPSAGIILIEKRRWFGSPRATRAGICRPHFRGARHASSRRHFLHLAAGAAALPAVSRIAKAPTRFALPTNMSVLATAFLESGHSDGHRPGWHV